MNRIVRFATIAAVAEARRSSSCSMATGLPRVTLLLSAEAACTASPLRQPIDDTPTRHERTQP